MTDNSYKYFKNTACKYYPCHKTTNEFFNCMFCYCPLYLLEDCGGNYVDYKGIKDCSNCLIPHSKNGYEYVNKKLVMEMERRKKDVFK